MSYIILLLNLMKKYLISVLQLVNNITIENNDPTTMDFHRTSNNGIFKSGSSEPKTIRIIPTNNIFKELKVKGCIPNRYQT